MQYSEFIEIMSPAIMHFGDKTFSEVRLKMIHDRINYIGPEWLKKTVRTIVLEDDRYFNFDQAARDEINRQANLKFTEDVSSAHYAIQEQMTDKGFQDALKLFGGNNLMEAIKNVPKLS